MYTVSTGLYLKWEKNVNLKLKQILKDNNLMYLEVKLDGILSFKQHCQNTKQKVTARNKISRKLSNISWDAQPQVLRTYAIVLSLSAAEYAVPLTLNKLILQLTRQDELLHLKPTLTGKIYPLIGIAPLR